MLLKIIVKTGFSFLAPNAHCKSLKISTTVLSLLRLPLVVTASELDHYSLIYIFKYSDLSDGKSAFCSSCSCNLLLAKIDTKYSYTPVLLSIIYLYCTLPMYLLLTDQITIGVLAG